MGIEPAEGLAAREMALVVRERWELPASERESEKLFFSKTLQHDEHTPPSLPSCFSLVMTVFDLLLFSSLAPFLPFFFFFFFSPRSPLSLSSSSSQPLLIKRFFETFSYLPPLSDADTAKQVDYITRNGWVPALEFADPEHAYVSNENCIRMQTTSGYQDNRYWSMYKLPMFGCTDSSQVLKEIAAAAKSFPNAYIRLVAFNPDRQVQVAGMLVHRPTTVRGVFFLCWRSKKRRRKK